MIKRGDAFWVGMGGAFGALCRYWVGDALDGSFPWGILVCNVLGSVLLIVVMTVERRLHRGVVHFKAIGFCGSFTTVSTFSLQLVEMFMSGDLVQAFAYMVISLVGALVMIFCARSLVVWLCPEFWHGEPKR